MNGNNVQSSRVVMSNIMMLSDANPAGNVHGGVIMKHIDNAAGVVAVRHTRSITVTASIDKISFHYPVFIGDLLTLKASLNMVGRTSMEIGVRVESENLIHGTCHHIASGYLTFVALDEAGKPKEVPPLILETEDETRRNGEALDRKKFRLMEKQKEAEHQKRQ